VEFLKALPSGSIVADIGCGNGKYLGINKDLYMASDVTSDFPFAFICSG
jgi:alkylated DNA repair protein alkB family protein 8